MDGEIAAALDDAGIRHAKGVLGGLGLGVDKGAQLEFVGIAPVVCTVSVIYFIKFTGVKGLSLFAVAGFVDADAQGIAPQGADDALHGKRAVLVPNGRRGDVHIAAALDAPAAVHDDIFGIERHVAAAVEDAVGAVFDRSRFYAEVPARGNGTRFMGCECCACGFCAFSLLLVGCGRFFDIQLIPALRSYAAQLRDVLPNDGIEGFGFLFEETNFFLEVLLRRFVSLIDKCICFDGDVISVDAAAFVELYLLGGYRCAPAAVDEPRDMQCAVGVDGSGFGGDEFAAHVDAESFLRADETDLVCVHAADGCSVEGDRGCFARAFDRRCGKTAIGDVVRAADVRCVIGEDVGVDLLGTGEDFEAARSAGVDSFSLKGNDSLGDADTVKGAVAAEFRAPCGEHRPIRVDKAAAADTDAVFVGNDDVGSAARDFEEAVHVGDACARYLVHDDLRRTIGEVRVAVNPARKFGSGNGIAVVEDESCGIDAEFAVFVDGDARAVRCCDVDDGNAVICRRDDGTPLFGGCLVGDGRREADLLKCEHPER